MSGILTWHGGHKWEGSPEIRTSKKGQYECGPGIYSTTSLNTASKYSKGGGRIIKFTLDPEITWLEDVKIPLSDAAQFIKNSKYLQKRKILHDDLTLRFEKRDQEHFQGMLPLSFLVNLAINHQCLGGKASPEMAEFLATNGAQASLHRSTGNDDWVIVFDPKVITNFEIMNAKSIDWHEDQLPPIAKQLEKLRENALAL
jgi:hypothetical protein